MDIPFKNNTMNLFSHLEWHHKDVHAKAHRYSTTSSKQPTLQESLTASQPLSTPSARHKQLVTAIGNFIVKDMRPITVAECEGFRELLQMAYLLICASSCPVVVILHRQFSLPNILKWKERWNFQWVALPTAQSQLTCGPPSTRLAGIWACLATSLMLSGEQRVWSRLPKNFRWSTLVTTWMLL